MMKSFTFLYCFMMMNMIFMNLLLNLIPSFNKNIHPMIMGSIFLLLSMLSSMNMNLISNNSLMPFIIFLIIVGGLMIIFLYFTSFINNMKMMIKWNYITIMPVKFILIFIMMIYLMIKMNNMFSWIYLNEMKSLNILNNFSLMNTKMEFFYMYKYNKMYTTIIMMMYLFMCMTLIVKMLINKKMSLRKTN